MTQQETKPELITYPGWKSFMFLAGEYPAPTLQMADEYGITSPVRWLAHPDNHLRFKEPPYGAEHLQRWRDMIDTNFEVMAHGGKALASLAFAKDAFRNRIALVCGSGPSLEKNVALINSAVASDPNKYCVIAVNSAIALLDHVDIYVFSERDYDMKTWGFPAKRTRCNMLVTYPFAHTSCLTDVNCAIIALVNQGVADGLPQYCRELWAKNYPGAMLELPHMQETASLALFTAFWVGCKQWLLTGMDYSFTDKYYAGVSADRFDDSELAARFHYKGYIPYEMKDITGATVRTTAMQERNAWLQMLACLQYRQDAGVKVFNCSEGGILRYGMDEIIDLEGALHGLGIKTR